MVHVDNTRIIGGLWRGEMRCICAKAQDTDLSKLICEEWHRVHQERMLVEVQHVKAHRNRKEKEDMPLFEKISPRVVRRSRRTPALSEIAAGT